MTMLTNIPRFAPGRLDIRRGFALVLARLGRRIDRSVAAFIAHRAGQAALTELCSLDDRQLKDIGLYRTELNDAVFGSLEARRRMQRAQRY